MAMILDSHSRDNIVNGHLLYIKEGGIYWVKPIGPVIVGDFWEEVLNEALNQSYDS